MYSSILWESVFEIKRKYPFVRVSLLHGCVPVLSFGGGEFVTLYLADFTGEDWQDCTLALRFFEDILEAVSTDSDYAGVPLKKALGNKGVAIIPCLNTGLEGVTLSVAKFCKTNNVRSIYTLKCNGESIVKNTPTGELKVRAQQIGEVLSACSKLPLKSAGEERVEDKFATFVAKNLGTPAFTLELGADKPSAIGREYESSKEMLLISALV